MSASVEVAALRALGALVADRLGLSFPEERWPDLLRGVVAAGEEVGLARPEDWLGPLAGAAPEPRLLDALAAHLTVRETYFFRDPASFAALERDILPALISTRARAGRTLRLWSAGCCTGEEAWSLAIACQRALLELEGWSVSVLGTDVDRRALDRARAGIYTRWSFRGCDEAFKERHFRPAQGGGLVIDPGLRRLVHFAHLNLVEPGYPSVAGHTAALDVIFCRNVLMYLTPEHQGRVLAGLHACLAEDGWLLLGPAEGIAARIPTLSMEERQGAIVYRKVPARSAPPALPVPRTLLVAAGPPAPRPSPARPPAAPDPAPPAGPEAAPEGGWLALARSQADRGEMEEALESCRCAIAAARSEPAAHLLHAAICQHLGRPEEAVTALGRVLYLDPHSIVAHHALGALYRHLRRPRKSARHYALVLSLLESRDREEIVPDSGGMTCGRLAEAVRAAVGG